MRSSLLACLCPALLSTSVVSAFTAVDTRRGFLSSTSDVVVPPPSTARRLSSLKWSPYEDDPVMRLPMYEAQLRDQGSNPELELSIEDARIAAELDVRKAQMAFYQAFACRSMTLMEEIWSVDYPCRCIHPGMVALDGRDAVLGSWNHIFTQVEHQDAWTIEPSRPVIDICGNTAVCNCIETMNGGGQLEVINIYKRERG